MPSLPPFILIFPESTKGTQWPVLPPKWIEAVGLVLFQSVLSTNRICFQDAKGFTLLHRQKRHSLQRFKAGIDFYETSEMHIISTIAWQKLARESPRLCLTSLYSEVCFRSAFRQNKKSNHKNRLLPSDRSESVYVGRTQDPEWSFMSFPGQQNTTLSLRY